jgi:hypothetical protein
MVNRLGEFNAFYLAVLGLNSGFKLARQVLYYLNHTPRVFRLLELFLRGSCV